MLQKTVTKTSKVTFLTPSYAHVHVHIRGGKGGGEGLVKNQRFSDVFRGYRNVKLD